MSPRLTLILLAFISAFSLSACNKDSATDKSGAHSEKDHAHKEGEKDAHGHKGDDKGGHGKGGKEAVAGGGLSLTDNEINAAGIRVAEATLTEMLDAVRVTALVQAIPSRVARVAPRIPARVVTVRASVGDRVSRGQALAVLDSIELGEARAAHAQARSELALAQANFERVDQLVREEIIAGKERLRALGDLEKARAAARASAGRLQLLGVAPDKDAGPLVSTFTLTAPLAGVVIEQHDTAVGVLSQPDKPLYTIADLSTIWVEGRLYERDLARVQTGAGAEVTVEAYPNDRFKGKVTSLSSVMDKETRTVGARIEVLNADGRLRPGMFATASIATAQKARVLALPNEAVVIVQGVPTVFVEGAKGFETRAVETGDRTASSIVIKSGVKAGDQVVVEGAYALKARMLKSQIGEGHAH